MLDIRFVRDNAEAVQENARRKGYQVNIPELLGVDNERRRLQQQADGLRARRNDIAASMKGGRPTPELVEEGRRIKEELFGIEGRLSAAELQCDELLRAVPNMAMPDVPVGASEAENVVIRTVGEPVELGFAPRTHADIAELRGWLDKERAAKVAGSRFAYLKGDLVKLQFAVIQFVIDKLTDQKFIDDVIAENNLSVSHKVFTPVLPPFMIRTDMFDAMDRLQPSEDRYKIEDEDVWLQGSAEHVLGSMYAGETLLEADLPVRLVGYATSFRREAGSYGKDMEGIFRMHQFDKLEMECLTTAEDGPGEHLLLVAIQEKLMSELEIPYHVLQKCTYDIGKPNARGVDIEAWLPGQANYRETHTADYMTDYQARRLRTQVRRGSGELVLVHTNDATALALSRGLIAIIENHQLADGHVSVPMVLRPYLGGREVL